VTLREERRLRVLENRVLRKIFRPKRKEVTGEWRRLHKEGLYDLYLPLTKYYSGDQIEKNEVGEDRCIYGLVGKPDEKRTLGRIILRWIFRQ
jgi:hypothetical protein